MEVSKMERLACFHLCVVIFVVNITLSGCGFGTVVPIHTRIDEANRKFDAAEAYLLVAREDEARDRRREQIEQKNSLYDDALTAYRAIVNADPSGEYALRSLLRMSEIYKKHREWNKVIESYEAILAIAPTGYYADRAKSALADIRRYRRLIEERRHRYQKYSALYAQDNICTHRRIAADALFDVANGYEQLGDYRTAIESYQRVVDEFPDRRSVWIKILEIYYYKLFDYGGGSPVYTKIVEMYSGSIVSKAITLMRKTSIPAHRIRGFRKVIESLSDKNTKTHAGQSKLPDFDKNFFSTMENIVRAYKTIAHNYRELRNYAGVISTYRELADRYGYKFDAVHAHHGIGMLYATKGQVHQAVDAFQNLLDYSPESVHLADEVYQYAVANRNHSQFTDAYEYFKIYINIGRGLNHYQEAAQILRQLETDEDGDGYKSYIELDAGTSDQDPHSHPRKQL